MRIYVVGVSKGGGGPLPKNFGTCICATHLQTAGAVIITKNGGGKILGCLKMGAVNYVLIMSPFLRDFKEF